MVPTNKVYLNGGFPTWDEVATFLSCIYIFRLNLCCAGLVYDIPGPMQKEQAIFRSPICEKALADSADTAMNSLHTKYLCRKILNTAPCSRTN
jgi:hypothetical protein